MAETRPKNTNKAKQTAVKKVPERRCVGCQGTFPKKELLRVVRSPEGEISIDFTGKKSGRGAYLCQNEACFKKAKKSGILKRALECEISDEIYAQLEKEIKVSEELRGETE